LRDSIENASGKAGALHTFGARRNESALQSMPLPTLSCRKNGENHNVMAHLNNLNPDHIIIQTNLFRQNTHKTLNEFYFLGKYGEILSFSHFFYFFNKRNRIGPVFRKIREFVLPFVDLR
jgi:hypothetical protein